MKMTKLTKLSLAFAIICAVLCGVAIAPLIVLAIFAIVALFCLVICALIYLAGAIVWLFSGTSIFSAGPVVYGFAISLFSYIVPIAKFSCFYITPYAGYASLTAGVVGVVISIVALVKARHEPKEEPEKSPQALNAPSEVSVGTPENSSDNNGQGGGIFDPYSVYNAEGKAVRKKEEKGKKDKKPRVKKAKTAKGVCVASLIVCIVFAAIAVAAIIFAHISEGMFV